MKIFLSILAALFCTSVLAADLPTKAAAYVGYPTTNGFYYGIGTGGNAGAVSGGAIGTQIVQGEIDAIIGYTGEFRQRVSFAEMQGGFSNLNGNSNGFSLYWPGVFVERVGVGSPINNLLNILPSFNFPSVPTLRYAGRIAASPAICTCSPASLSKISASSRPRPRPTTGSYPHLSARAFLTRLSNNVVLDTSAGWQNDRDKFGLPRRRSSMREAGKIIRIGTSLKY